MRKTAMVILILVAVAAIGFGTSYAGRGERGERGDHPFPNLTEEQRTAVHELVSTMREAGATRDEIHAAVDALFESWGIERPEPPEGGGGGPGGGRGEGRPEGGGPQHRLMDLLTEEQQTAVHELVSSMRETGATRDEIHAAVRELVESWGIELPEPPEGGRGGEGPRGGRGQHHGLMNQLTEEQRAELHKLVRGLHDAGASRDEIHDAVQSLLESWGIEPPARSGGNDTGSEALKSPADEGSATWGRIKGDFR